MSLYNIHIKATHTHKNKETSEAGLINMVSSASLPVTVLLLVLDSNTGPALVFLCDVSCGCSPPRPTVTLTGGVLELMDWWTSLLGHFCQRLMNYIHLSICSKLTPAARSIHWTTVITAFHTFNSSAFVAPHSFVCLSQSRCVHYYLPGCAGCWCNQR